MAFEAFKAQSEAPARAGRKRLWYALSIGVHGALIAVGIAYSFWHIEELSPPLLKVTFLSAAPPPPPAAPPPAGGGATPKKPPKVVKPKVIVQPKPEDLVQPKEIKKEEPKEEPKAEDHGETNGVKGGTIGGTPGGTIGGTPGGTIGGTIGGTGPAGRPAPAKFLPPNMAKQQLIDGPDPVFPPSLNHGGIVYRVLVKICVTTTGSVDRVTLMKGADSVLDENVVTKVKTWRFRPLLANNVPVPFCYPATFEFKSQ